MAITRYSFPAEDRSAADGDSMPAISNAPSLDPGCGKQGAIQVHAGNMTPTPMHPGLPDTRPISKTSMMAIM